MTLYGQALGFVAILVFVSGFIGALIFYSGAAHRTRLAIVALSWVLAIVLYRVIFFVMPEDSSLGYVAFMGLAFVFVFAFWGVIDLAIHSNARLRGGETARFAQGAALLVLSVALFAAAYFLPDALALVLPDAGFAAYLLGILGTALAAILCFRAGARAAYANRAAVPNLLSARKASVEVTPERTVYMPGETVRARVRVRGKKDFEIGGARAELLYEIRYSYLTPDPRGGSLLVEETDREIVDTERLPIRGSMRKGKANECGVSLDLPAVVPPTGEGEITGVSWALGVALEVPTGTDVVAETPVTVVSAPDTYEERAGRGQEVTPSRSVEIKFKASARALRAGGRVEGRLVVTALEAFEAREVRVELVRREIVRRDDCNHHETVEARETLAGRTGFRPRTSRAYAIGVTVPKDLRCPASETAHTYVGWFLRGVIGRGQRPDHTVEQELNVFGGPLEDHTA